MTNDENEDLLDVCLTRGGLDNFTVNKCDKCGRGDSLSFFGLQMLLQYRADGIEELEQYW